MKNKFYAIGSLIAVIGPTMAIVSCTDSDDQGDNPGNNPVDNPGSKDTSIVKSSKITKAERYIEQETLYVVYNDDVQLDKNDNSGELKDEVVEAIAAFAASIPASKTFDTLMVRFEGFFKNNAVSQDQYVIEISDANYPPLNDKKITQFKTMIQNAWKNAKTKINLSDNVAKEGNDFDLLVIGGISSWKAVIEIEVNKVLGANWDSKNLMSWRGGKPENLASGVDSIGSMDSLVAVQASDFTDIVRRLFVANFEVLQQDHQSSLLTILWYYKNKSINKNLNEITKDVAIKIHKAFVDAKNNSFARNQDDLDPKTFLDGLAGVSNELASFVTSGVPFSKETF